MIPATFIPYAANIYPNCNKDKNFMNTSSTLAIKENTRLENEYRTLSWKDSPSVQRLLDVIAFIVALEYVQIAKQNQEVFLSGGASK